MHTSDSQPRSLRVGLIGFGMIVAQTYRPFLERSAHDPLFTASTGPVRVSLEAIATRTGTRVDEYRRTAPGPLDQVASYFGPTAISDLLAHNIDTICIATPDHRHFHPAKEALSRQKHVLIEKPSVLSLQDLDDLTALAAKNQVLAKVVYHKLADPDHKRLRTFVHDAVLKHVNNGFCSLLEPKMISGVQFTEWLTGRNPATYVAVHYLKLIDFTFGPAWTLDRISATGQRGLTDSPVSSTWDSVQLQVVYRHPDRREAAFDIHTSWVNPDNFPGYVEQEVQFRFDNAVWNAHQRKRGVEVTVEGLTPNQIKITPNNHFNADSLEPWGERTQRGYGIEVIERFFREVAYVEFGGPGSERPMRLKQMRQLTYNDLSADRNCVAIIQALEAILARAAVGIPGCLVKVNTDEGGLVLYEPGNSNPIVLYDDRV